MVSTTQKAVNQASDSLRQFATKTQGKKGELNKNDFLNLFMTQVANQDPLSPMDSSGMMTQMSQMGSMEQLQNLNTEVAGLKQVQSEILKLNSTGLLGTEIAFEDNTITLDGGNSNGIGYSLSDDSTTTIARIIDSEGKIVRNLSLGSVLKGKSRLEWDGKDDKGESLKDGKFKVEMMAVTPKGQEIPVDMKRSDRVNKIEFKDGQPLFFLGDRPMTLGEINTVHRQTGSLLNRAEPLPTKVF